VVQSDECYCGIKALTVGRDESVRAKITTTIEEALLNKAKALAKQEGLSGANAIIERALELYFTSIQSEVWEKSLSSGWIKKLVLKRDSILYENIKCRKTMENCRPDDYTPESLKAKGWKKV
jgi:hypothetical protein